MPVASGLFWTKDDVLDFWNFGFCSISTWQLFMKEPNTAELVELPEIQTTIADQEMKIILPAKCCIL